MSPFKLVFIAASGALLIGACSSPSPSASSPASTVPAASTPIVSAPASATAAATAAAATGLSGKWSGQYSGAYQGTFALRWRQSGSNVRGTIKISAPASSFAIRGTVVNGTIRFGTVGSMAITYSGTVSGNSMSGSYQVGGSPGGPWSASRAS
jgi:hypothetical protein